MKTSNSMNPTDPIHTGTAATSMLENLLKARHTCRAILPRPLPGATIEKLLSIVQRTPSWCNTQPWQVHIVSGDVLDEFRDRYVGRARESEGSVDLELPLANRGEYLARRKGMRLRAVCEPRHRAGRKGPRRRTGVGERSFFSRAAPGCHLHGARPGVLWVAEAISVSSCLLRRVSASPRCPRPRCPKPRWECTRRSCGNSSRSLMAVKSSPRSHSDWSERTIRPTLSARHAPVSMTS